MQKIIFATDGLSLNYDSLKFACFLAQLTNSKLTGIFLENLVENEKFVLRPAYGTVYADWEVNESSPAFVEKMNKIKKNISSFREFCEKNAVRSEVRLDPGVPLHELISETRFADLLVISAGTTFERNDDAWPTDFIKNVLKDSECPVMVAPEQFDSIEELIFTYDGGRSSALAIRQFTYLFPLLNDRKVTVIQVNKKGEWPPEEKQNIREWLQTHYYSVNFESLKGSAEDVMLPYLFGKKRVLIVMGAFGRSAMSMFFRQSRAEKIMQMIPQPIFISHH